MPKQKVDFWTGPTLVSELAEKVREAGLELLLEGTERIYLAVEGTTPEAAKWNALAQLEKTHGTSFGLR